jgi:hypothetical protein
MVKRRKFLIGVGSLAAGSAAAMGTGAFSAMQTEARQVNVQTTGDGSGYVRISPNSNNVGKYVGYENGKIEFNPSEFTEGGGAAPNKDAVFYYDSAFTIDIEDDLASAYKGRWVEGDFEVTIYDGEERLPGVDFYVGDTRDTDAGVEDVLLGTKAGSGPDEVVVGFCVDTSEIPSEGNVGSVSIELEGEGQGGDF